MDTIIVLLSGCFIFIYLAIQRIYLKTIPFEKRVAWQKKITILITTLSFFCSFVFIQQQQIISTLEASCIVALIVCLFCIVYVLSIFSFFESSITIKILSLFPIDKRPISRNNIRTSYSLHEIIARRLKRLVFEGILTKEKNKYIYRKTPYSLFILREYLYTATQWLFP